MPGNGFGNFFSEGFYFWLKHFSANIGITLLEVYAGTTLKGEFTLESETGNKIAASDYDDAAFAGIRFGFAY